MGATVLPNSVRAVIDEGKLSEYLLNQNHRGNGGKAAFFLSLGYDATEVAALRNALAQVASVGRVVRQTHSVHGRKFVVDGALLPKTTGSPRRVRTIWIVERKGDAPRLVTAYPQGG